MITCPKCNERVNNTLLRMENPKCENGHDLGIWVHCAGPEKHVYLRKDVEPCPHCNLEGIEKVASGELVKCLHVTEEGKPCITRPFKWITEGPPCFMNHLSKMKLAV